MKKLAAILLIVLISPFLSLPNRLQPSFRNFLSEHTGTKEKKLRMIFATFAENQEQLEYVFILAESIRNFAGNFRLSGSSIPSTASSLSATMSTSGISPLAGAKGSKGQLKSYPG